MLTDHNKKLLTLYWQKNKPAQYIELKTRAGDT